MYISLSPGTAWGMLCMPLCIFLSPGIGWGMFCVSVFTGTYYNMVVAWCLFYMVASFAKDVPWRDCGNWWNTIGRDTPGMSQWGRLQQMLTCKFMQSRSFFSAYLCKCSFATRNRTKLSENVLLLRCLGGIRLFADYRVSPFSAHFDEIQIFYILCSSVVTLLWNRIPYWFS